MSAATLKGKKMVVHRMEWK